MKPLRILLLDDYPDLAEQSLRRCLELFSHAGGKGAELPLAPPWTIRVMGKDRKIVVDRIEDPRAAERALSELASESNAHLILLDNDWTKKETTVREHFPRLAEEVDEPAVEKFGLWLLKQCRGSGQDVDKDSYPIVAVFSQFGNENAEYMQAAGASGAMFIQKNAPHQLANLIVMLLAGPENEDLEGIEADMAKGLVASEPRLRSKSAQFQAAVRLAGRYAVYPRVHVLLTGESGCGKGEVARAIHRLSPVGQGPWVHINCGAIPRGLEPSIFQGSERGSFTGAEREALGLFRQAAGGTLFIDEIDRLSWEGQGVLHTATDSEGTFTPVGGSEHERQCRIIAASNKDLSALTKSGEFAGDLLQRLESFRIHIPPLRERQEDLLDLAHELLRDFCQVHERPVPRLTDEAISAMCAYHWPGNIRELRGAMERSVITCRRGKITPEDLGLDSTHVHSPGAHPRIEAPEQDFRHVLLGAARTSSPRWRRVAKMLLEAHPHPLPLAELCNVLGIDAPAEPLPSQIKTGIHRLRKLWEAHGYEILNSDDGYVVTKPAEGQ